MSDTLSDGHPPGTTTDGSPCQNCIQRDERCHQHPPGEQTHAPALEHANQDAMLELALLGGTLKNIAETGGMSYETLRRYLRHYEAHEDAPEHRDECRVCGFCAELRARRARRYRQVLSQVDERDLLYTTFGHQKAERRELVGDGGGPIEERLRVELHPIDVEEEEGETDG